MYSMVLQYDMHTSGIFSAVFKRDNADYIVQYLEPPLFFSYPWMSFLDSKEECMKPCMLPKIKYLPFVKMNPTNSR